MSYSAPNTTDAVTAREEAVIDALLAAEDHAETIEMYGNTIILPGGATVKAITDERPQEVVNELNAQDITNAPQGRRCLFHFVPGTLPAETRTLTYDGIRWATQPPRSTISCDVPIVLVVIGYAGHV